MPFGFTRLQGFGNRFTSTMPSPKKGSRLQVAKADEARLQGDPLIKSPNCAPRFNLIPTNFSSFQILFYRLSLLLSYWIGFSFPQQQSTPPIPLHPNPQAINNEALPQQPHLDMLTPSEPESFAKDATNAPLNHPQTEEIEQKRDNSFSLTHTLQSPIHSPLTFKPSSQHLWESVRAGDAMSVQRFVKLGMNVNLSLGKYQRTPLHEATIQNDVPVVKALLEATDIQINASDCLGLRAIDLAVINNQPEIVTLLLAKGASLEGNNHKFPLTNSPLYLAVLLGERPMVNLLLQNHAPVNGRSLFQDTPLHCAVTCRRYKIAQDLLVYGADITLPNQFGQTPVHRAAISGDPKIMALLLSHHKTRLNAQDALRRSPLHYAALHDHLQIVDLLKAHQADFDLKDQYGETPRDILMKRRKIRTSRDHLLNLGETPEAQLELFQPFF